MGPPHGVGVGPITSVIDILQFPVSASYRVTDHLWVGGGPTLGVGLIVADPGLFAAPDHADRDSFPAFAPATHSRFSWGAGFQLGAYYATDAGWDFGASFKSPMWFAPYVFDSRDEAGFPRSLSFRLDFPLIVSMGVAYRGFDRWLLAADVRWIDYKDARGFGAGGFNPDFSVAGLGWNSIWMGALGAQYQVNDALSVRLGYTGTQNPVPSTFTSNNIASPAIIEHILALGATYQISRTLSASVGYAHGFKNSISGPLQTPFGPLPFVNIQSSAYYDALLFGASVVF
jgi:long-chain fatty acid transport protein